MAAHRSFSDSKLASLAKATAAAEGGGAGYVRGGGTGYVGGGGAGYVGGGVAPASNSTSSDSLEPLGEIDSSSHHSNAGRG